MYLSIDIGGTKTLIALFSRHGRVVRRYKFKTAASSDVFVKDLVDILTGFASPKLKAATVAIPGHVRFEQKIYSVKFGNRDWGWVDISTPLKNVLSCPIFFENDANLASIYESKGLKGRTVFLTFSTGVGGGVAENGKLLVTDEGRFEPGHVKYEYCGRVAEWEDIAAASALEKVYQIDRATDVRGKETLQDVAARVALGLPDIIAKYHPETIVLGGPLGKIFKLYARYLPNLGVRFKRPKRPLESVIYGCYLYSRSKVR